MKDKPKKEKICDNVSHILLIGSYCAAGLLVLGLGSLFFLTPSDSKPGDLARPEFSELISHLIKGEPAAVISLGILVMMFTPFLRVVVATFSFLGEGDLKYAFIAFGVLIILLFTIVPNLL
jgi:uncharacterized membrane protein